MQKIVTCLAYNDRAEEAVNFYTSIFPNSKILGITRWGDTGPGKKGDVMAMEFELDGERYLALNGGAPFTFTMGMSLMVQCNTQKEIDYFWEKLSEGGETNVCGWLTDKFGVSWQVVPSMIGELLREPATAERVMNEVMKEAKLDIAKILAAAEGK